MQLIQSHPEKLIVFNVSEKPNADFKVNFTYIHLPELNFKESSVSDSNLSSPTSSPQYEFPDATSTQYKDVFDPKLRKKLIDAQIFNIPPKLEKSKSWTESDSRVFIDMGNG